LNVMTDIKECFILYSEINGKYPKKVKLGLKEKERIEKLPTLMNCLNWDELPKKAYRAEIIWTDELSQIIPE